MSFDFAGTGASPGLTGGDWLGAGINLLDSGITNATNYAIASENKKLQEQTNSQNESLMRESWLRDDNAVQRRVADLKAAGLSPVLAAGSAAGNSGAIQLNSPQLNYKMEKMDPLSALAMVQQVKGQVLDNQLKALGVRYYGMPDWLIGVQRVLGELPHDNVLRKGIENALSFLGGLGSDNPGVHYTVNGEDPGSSGPHSSQLGYEINESMLHLIKSSSLTSENLSSVANDLSKKYNVSVDYVLDKLYDAWDRFHGDY